MALFLLIVIFLFVCLGAYYLGVYLGYKEEE